MDTTLSINERSRKQKLADPPRPARSIPPPAQDTGTYVTPDELTSMQLGARVPASRYVGFGEEAVVELSDGGDDGQSDDGGDDEQTAAAQQDLTAACLSELGSQHSDLDHFLQDPPPPVPAGYSSERQSQLPIFHSHTVHAQSAGPRPPLRQGQTNMTAGDEAFLNSLRAPTNRSGYRYGPNQVNVRPRATLRGALDAHPQPQPYHGALEASTVYQHPPDQRQQSSQGLHIQTSVFQPVGTNEGQFDWRQAPSASSMWSPSPGQSQTPSTILSENPSGLSSEGYQNSPGMFSDTELGGMFAPNFLPGNMGPPLKRPSADGSSVFSSPSLAKRRQSDGFSTRTYTLTGNLTVHTMQPDGSMTSKDIPISNMSLHSDIGRRIAKEYHQLEAAAYADDADDDGCR